MLVECWRHPASKVLRQVPTLGTVRIAQLIAAAPLSLQASFLVVLRASGADTF